MTTQELAGYLIRNGYVLAYSSPFGEYRIFRVGEYLIHIQDTAWIEYAKHEFKDVEFSIVDDHLVVSKVLNPRDHGIVHD